MRILLGATAGSLLSVGVLAAQASSGLAVGDVFGTVGFAAGAGALIAWGGQREKVESHAQRLDSLEADRVTRDDIHAFDNRLTRIQDDMRSMRETAESRMLQLLEMLDRRPRGE